jgi:hypothetical protein
MNSREMNREKTGNRPVIIPRAMPSARPDRARPSVFEIDVPAAAPRRRGARDRWALALAVVGVCVLTAAIFAYVVDPAITTLSAGSTNTWSAEGP